MEGIRGEAYRTRVGSCSPILQGIQRQGGRRDRKFWGPGDSGPNSRLSLEPALLELEELKVYRVAGFWGLGACRGQSYTHAATVLLRIV